MSQHFISMSSLLDGSFPARFQTVGDFQRLWNLFSLLKLLKILVFANLFLELLYADCNQIESG